MRFTLALFLLLLPVSAQTAADWIDLLPSPDLKGWTRIPIPAVSGLNPKVQWRVDADAKTLICTGDGGHEWLRTDKDFGDFILQVDWKFTPKDGETKYNSGIGLRLSRQGEIWYQAQTGLAGGWLFGNNIAGGVLKSFNLRNEMKENRIKPAGEWNHYEVRAIGDKLTLEINGAVVSEFPTAGHLRGHIGLEAEGYEITFRNLKIRELPAKP